ncbi:MAG: imidazole glycerol phosphate synthase subunit HisF [Akkermansiaceae bacterium]|jgi:imidazole glycerol phosphate synthase subunit HisF
MKSGGSFEQCDNFQAAVEVETMLIVGGFIKEVLGFRRFMLRGMEKVGLESDLLKSSYNLKKMDHLGMRFSAS